MPRNRTVKKINSAARRATVSVQAVIDPTRFSVSPGVGFSRLGQGEVAF